MRQVMTACALLVLAGCVEADNGPRRPVTSQVSSRSCDTSFQVVNTSSSTVDGFHFGPSSQQSWGPDRLGSTSLPPGSTTNFRAANTGNYDFRAVWRGGRTAEVMRIDVCRMNRITVTNGGLRVS